MSPFTIEVFAFTHQGKVRATNQDAFRVGGTIVSGAPEANHCQVVLEDDLPLLLAVADGVGGRPAGALASDMALRSFEMEGIEPSEDAIRSALDASNAKLYDRMVDEPSCNGMGSTIAGILLSHDGGLAFGVGDAYVGRFNGVRLRPLLECHTTDGTPGGTITQALGCADEKCPLNPSFAHLGTSESVFFLVSSDGIARYLSPELISPWTKNELSAEQAGRQLMAAVLATEAKDNLTGILAKITMMEGSEYGQRD